jgi:hypothetical protein
VQATNATALTIANLAKNFDIEPPKPAGNSAPVFGQSTAQRQGDPPVDPRARKVRLVAKKNSVVYRVARFSRARPMK